MKHFFAVGDDKNLRVLLSMLAVVFIFSLPGGASAKDLGAFSQMAAKPKPEAVLKLFQEGNERFASGRSIHPHMDAARLRQAGMESQNDHALATVITCSDSRVPVELLFDQGIMDVFVIRVAGNVVRTDEAGSLEYGMAHVDTPLTIVLGHTQCGAVTAVTQAAFGHGHELECNIVPLVAPIRPAVDRAMLALPGSEAEVVIPAAIKENVWQAIADLFRQSPTAREYHGSGMGKVVGAIYDVSTGHVNWLPSGNVDDILKFVELDPGRTMNRMGK